MTIANDDDDFTIINGQKVLKDGRTLKVRMTAMDHQTVTDDVRLHQPGFRITTDAAAIDRRETAYSDFLADLNNGWRNPPPVVIADEKKAPVTTDARETAHAEMVRNLENAWRGAAA
jgi:hypothetical protein